MGKKPKPTIVSPEHTRRTNSFIDLASSDEESVNSDQPEENFLPNSTVNDSTVNKQPTAPNKQQPKTNTDSDESSMDESTDGYKLDTKVTKEDLIALMEDIQPGCVSDGQSTTYTYTEVADFRLIMGKALTMVQAPYTHFGYSYIVDTDDIYTKRTGQPPPPIPKIPDVPAADATKQQL